MKIVSQYQNEMTCDLSLTNDKSRLVSVSIYVRGKKSVIIIKMLNMRTYLM